MADEQVHSTGLSSNDEDFELMHQAEVNSHHVADTSDLNLDNNLKSAGDSDDLMFSDNLPSKELPAGDQSFPDYSPQAAESSPDDFVELNYNKSSEMESENTTDLDQPEDNHSINAEEKEDVLPSPDEEVIEPHPTEVVEALPEEIEEPPLEQEESIPNESQSAGRAFIIEEEVEEHIADKVHLEPVHVAPAEVEECPPFMQPSPQKTPPRTPVEEPVDFLSQPASFSAKMEESNDSVVPKSPSVMSKIDPRETSQKGEEQLDFRSIVELFYFRKPIKSGLVLASLLLLEFGLVFCSVISVISYAGLAFLLFTASIRIYSHLFKKSDDGFVFKNYLETDISISRDQTEQVTRRVCDKINAWVLCSRDLFLITNYVESFKLAVLLYLLTYIGARFNFLTLCILATVSLFTLPKIYETYQVQIDQLWDLTKGKFNEVMTQVRAKIETLPIVGKKTKTN